MDIVKQVIPNVGEVGIDTEASPGNGQWYVKHYASGYDVCGFDSQTEAIAELKYLDKNQDEIEAYSDAGGTSGFNSDPVIENFYGMH